MPRNVNFENLQFECKPIEATKTKKLTFLLRYMLVIRQQTMQLQKGIVAKAGLIVCAPCCHKHIRQQLKGKEQEIRF